MLLKVGEKSFQDTRRAIDLQGRSFDVQDTSNAGLTRVYDDPSALELARCSTQLLLQSPPRALWDDESQRAQVFKGRPSPTLTYTDPAKSTASSGFASGRPGGDNSLDSAPTPLSMAMTMSIRNSEAQAMALSKSGSAPNNLARTPMKGGGDGGGGQLPSSPGLKVVRATMPPRKSSQRIGPVGRLGNPGSAQGEDRWNPPIVAVKVGADR